LVRRTLATFRIAELGFLGVVVYTRVHTPLRCGHESKAADLLFFARSLRPFRTSCDMVGIRYTCFNPLFKGLQM
jgi:hypothetical protein